MRQTLVTVFTNLILIGILITFYKTINFEVAVLLGIGWIASDMHLIKAKYRGYDNY